MDRPLVFPVSSNTDNEFNALIQFFNETLGFCPNSVKTMYHRPHIAKAFIELNKAVMQNDGRVGSSLKRLIGYVSSNAAGCRYCQAHTMRAAERYDTEMEKMENIWDFRTYPVFTEPERAALAFAVASSTIPNAFDDEISENLRSYWDDGEITEILGVVSLFGFLNRWNDSMGTEIEAGAIETGEKFLKKQGWTSGKHTY